VFNVLDGVLSLAGFQVNLIGRFWVTAEAFLPLALTLRLVAVRRS
jgi:hypothetical protein